MSQISIEFQNKYYESFYRHLKFPNLLYFARMIDGANEQLSFVTMMMIGRVDANCRANSCQKFKKSKDWKKSGKREMSCKLMPGYLLASG